jgi:hypothetical protein
MDNLIDVTAQVIVPLMALAFLVGIVVRVLLYYVARSEAAFALEFEKRVRRGITDQESGAIPRQESFHRFARVALEQTYDDCFEKKNKYKRRNFDHITSITDRLFLIQEGTARVIQDTLKQTRYFKRDTAHQPKMVDLTKNVFENNPYFNKLFGVFPVALMNELLNILPGLFIIAGIFGTFLGISKGLPELSGMDLGNIEGTKKIMDMFLMKISQSMLKSILGIGLSVCMSLLNTILSPEGMYYNLVNRFSSSLDQIWNETTTNEYDRNEAPFVGTIHTSAPADKANHRAA